MPEPIAIDRESNRTVGEFAPFPKEEFEARYTIIRNRMQEQGMVALLCMTEPNYRYLTGHHNQRWANTVRPRAVLLPLVGEPVIMQIGSEGWGIEEVTHVRDIRSVAGRRIHDGYEEQLAGLIAETLADIGISKGRVGTERGWQMQPGMSVDGFAFLEQEVAPLKLVDAAQLLWGVRMLKSPREIDCIRRAGEINNKTYRQLRKEIKVGITEREIERRARSLLHEYGAERTTYIPVDIHNGRWPAENHKFFGYSTDRKLMPNGIVDMDCGCSVEGYWSDYNRTFAVGNPPEIARKAYRALQIVVDAGLAAVKPGEPIASVFRAMADAMTKVGAKDSIGATLGGHGLGLSATERPLVSTMDDTIMSPGLYFTVEPITTVEGWGVTLAEEMLVVTSTGYELLSERADPELPIVG